MLELGPVATRLKNKEVFKSVENCRERLNGSYNRGYLYITRRNRAKDTSPS